jgi:hypothetical protein
MALAYRYLRDAHDVPVYQQLFMREGVKFQYPTSSLFVMMITQDPVVLNLTSALMVLLMCALVVWIVEEQVRRGVLGDEPGDIGLAWPARVGLVLLMTVTFHPLVSAYRLGQIQTWLTVGYCAVVLLWIRGHQGWAGLIVGTLTLVKPQFGFLLAWGAVRRRWRFAVLGTATVLVGTAGAVATFGLVDTVDYLNLLVLLGRRGESYIANQSVNGLLNRLVGHDLTEWRVLPPFDPWVYAGGVMSSLALLLLSLTGPIRAKGGMSDLLIASLTSVLAAPIAWRHHYSVLLPAFGMLFVGAVRAPVWGRWTLPYLCACYSAIGVFQGTFFALKDSWLNVLQSYTLFGGLGALLHLYRLAWRPVTTPDGGGARHTMTAGGRSGAGR